MLPHNRQRLESYRQYYDSWVNDRYLFSLGGDVKEDIQRIIREEWQPGYTCQMWCGYCVAKMIVLAFESMDNETETVKVKF